MDCEIRRNVFHRAIGFPYATCCDMVGKVIKVGSEAYDDGLKVGDRVCCIDLYLGGNARYVAIQSDLLFRVPQDLDASEVACLLRSYMTAYQCLHRAGGRSIRDGDCIFVTGGNGCVGQGKF